MGNTASILADSHSHPSQSKTKSPLKLIEALDPGPRRILLVEDDLDMSIIIQQSLQGFFPKSKISIAVDPYEAMNLMMDISFDYIIADWNLPNMKAGHIVELAEKHFGMDPTLSMYWDSKKINVITFSTCSPEECNIPSSKHFNYLGHVHKKQPLIRILNDFSNYIHSKKNSKKQ